MKNLIIPAIVAVVFAATTNHGEKQNQNNEPSPANRLVGTIQPTGDKGIIMEKQKEKQEAYRKYKKLILNDICSWIRNAKKGGWPYFKDQFGYTIAPDEFDLVGEIIEEVYWEIKFRKNNMDNMP